MPKVSVIIPTYNRASLLPRALESVLRQTFRDSEVIVVDDGSTDHTQTVMRRFDGKVKYVRQNNQGSAAARNRGIQESSGEYIAFLDSDDYWVPEKLEEQVKILDTYKNVGIVYARMPIINEKGEKIGMKPAGISGKNFKELLEVWGDLPTSTVMTRRVCFEKAGMFDTSLVTMQDIDMWLRIARFYELYEIEGKVLAYYCRHDNQATSDKIKVYGGLVRIYTKIFNNFADAPREIMIKRIALNQYMLSRSYYDKHLYTEALRNLIATLIRYPHVGVIFFAQNDAFGTRILKIIKPYLYLGICSVKAAGQSIKNFLKFFIGKA